MPRRHWIGLLLCAVVMVASLATAFVILQYATNYYRDMMSLQLDPLGLSTRFPDEPESSPGNRITVMLLGDSRAAQWAPAGLPSDYVVVNRGIAGQTSAQILGRMDAHVRPIRPDIVVVQMGINDLKAIGLFPGRAVAIVGGLEANLEALVANLSRLGARIVLTTIFPTGRVPWRRRHVWSSETERAIVTVNEHIRALDDGKTVVVLDAYAILVGDDGRIRGEYVADQLHLNAAGYATLDRGLAAVLERLSAHLSNLPLAHAVD